MTKTTGETKTVDGSAFDHDGDGKVGGSKKKQTDAERIAELEAQVEKLKAEKADFEAKLAAATA